MDVKAAVNIAKKHIQDLFAEEDLKYLGLEEVELQLPSNEWVITLGFSRPWDEPRNSFAMLAQTSVPHREYKVVRISDGTNEVLSVKNREVRV